MQHYLSDLDLAAHYAVSRVTIWRWAEKGLLPRPVRIGPKATRWIKSEIERHDAELAARAESRVVGGEAA